VAIIGFILAWFLKKTDKGYLSGGKERLNTELKHTTADLNETKTLATQQATRPEAQKKPLQPCKTKKRQSPCT
jgi:hypothetical protein